MTIDRPCATGSLVAYDSDSELSRSMTAAQKVESRSDRRKRRNRQALIEAGYQIMAEKGIDAATMSEISELADVGAGTVYNYFASKDELAMCVMEQVMDRLSQRIEAVTNSFTDPAQVYAFGIRNVMKAATTDQRWRWLLRRSEVIADAMYRVMGPYAIRDIRNAVAAGRYRVEDPELAWRQATHAIVGFSLAVCDKNILPHKIDEAVVNLLGMVGVDRTEAWEVAKRPCPELPGE
jgi:AcrR family transcriptional regulator